jgi:hypothetical protein
MALFTRGFCPPAWGFGAMVPVARCWRHIFSTHARLTPNRCARACCEPMAWAAASDAPRAPVGGMAESPDPWVREVRQPRPRAPGRPLRDDAADRRARTCHRGRFLHPRQGKRHVPVTARHTTQHWAHGRYDLGAHHGPTAPGMRGGLDDVTTPTPAACSDTVAPAAPRRILGHRA